MKKITVLASALLLSASLSGCVVAPAPYYDGGRAPYYGTTYVPAYAYGEGAVGGYYPYQRSQHIYSNYDTNYWHHQRSAQQQHAQAQSAPAHNAHQRSDEQHR